MKKIHLKLILSIISFPGGRIAEIVKSIFGGYGRFILAIAMMWIIPTAVIAMMIISLLITIHWIWSL